MEGRFEIISLYILELLKLWYCLLLILGGREIPYNEGRNSLVPDPFITLSIWILRLFGRK